MDFYLLVSNLFIQEGIRSILSSKYPDSSIAIMQHLDEFKIDKIHEHAILITNDPSIFYNYQPKFKNLVFKKQIKTILIANSAQIEQLKEKDLKLVDALIYTNCSLNDLDEALSFIQSGLVYRCKKFQPLHSVQNTFETLLNEQQVSSREMEIVKLVIAGHTSHKIAGMLNISYYTVTTHRRNINKKLNLKNPQDLLRLSLDKNK
jgi:DNA-binding CsgD family transcriptional regulator